MKNFIIIITWMAVCLLTVNTFYASNLGNSLDASHSDGILAYFILHFVMS